MDLAALRKSPAHHLAAVLVVQLVQVPFIDLLFLVVHVQVAVPQYRVHREPLLLEVRIERLKVSAVEDGVEVVQSDAQQLQWQVQFVHLVPLFIS